MAEISKKFFVVSTPNLLFAPYLKSFIPTYHLWMQDPDTLFLTGSEPLTLEEELENQKSWLTDPKKCTFIICEKKNKETENLKIFEKLNSETFFEKNCENDWKELIKPIGDVNLFFHDYIDENEAEIDIMIGDKEARGNGYSKDGVKIMMEFGFAVYKKTRFIAKIKSENQVSRKLFERLGYDFKREVKAFDEVVYEFDCEEKKTSPKEFFDLKLEIQEALIEDI